MLDRNTIVRQNLIRDVQEDRLPKGSVRASLQDAGLSPEQLIDLFETQVMSRHLDLQSRKMQKEGKSFYTIGSAGHEGNAAVAAALRPDDMAFLHYRSGAFVIQRSKQKPGTTPLYDMLLSFAASSEDPISGGRHKVLGSKDLFIPPQTSTIASHLPKAMGAAYSIALTNKLGIDSVMRPDGVVLCSFGDASANHSTALGAINAASWASYQSIPMPILFVCEDNGIGISTPTPQGWIHANFANRAALEYRYCDGLNLVDTYQTAKAAADWVRRRRKPLFLHVRTVRLLGHAGSDSEFAYRQLAAIEASERQDPLLYSAGLLLDNQILSGDEIIQLYLEVEQRIARISERAASRPKLTHAAQIKAALIPPKRHASVPKPVDRNTLFSHEKHNLGKPQHLAKLINWALLDLMAQHEEIVMCGEDIGRKGGVYNVTAKLYEKFGAPRVTNTLLDEQSILGMAIGMAHNGLLPIPEIQFLAYVHNAEDQIRGEAATLPFFSNGQYSNPMVIRIAGLAYQKGFGGHFHNDNSFAVFRDIPGLILACPSNGADAVEMLRECVRLAREEQRLVVFLEPIALYMKKDLHEEGDNLWSFPYVPPEQAGRLPLGEPGVYGEGEDLCIVSYGNGYYLSRQAEKQLAEQGIRCKVVDLRWLVPLNEEAIIEQTRGYNKVLIVDECRQTASVSEALVTLITEARQALGQALPQLKRLCAEDCFIPLGSASYEVLPSSDEIVALAREMVGKPDQNAARYREVS
ncbi:dehydrogenase E1 component subunit alpha/beta [Bowmanella dokdonensis]|uniref:3-methyl-2-oxobutanoate dehydrogenase (2-methylpropanoyl-transferring) n=1 Tax=Bowmanella dokdonensis TaxID=751969 RepID=A0A939DJG9_9ALTE|nr:alpha-ketoacid dehydrogenase subunit alpha/beta [Bowmanella dokdonensis]MBN7823833.1 MFS transporter [Bowmanella dokdonensis]